MLSTHTANCGVARCIMAAATALILCGREASAQRTMNTQVHTTISYALPFSGHDGIGADLSAGTYLLSSLWKAGVTGTKRACRLGESGSMDFAHITAYGEWMWRFVGSMSRAVCMYVGGGAFLGYEAYDPFRRLPDHIQTGLGRGAFLYGLHASLETEVFITSRIAAVITGRLPVNMTSPIARVNPMIQIGIRADI